MVREVVMAPAPGVKVLRALNVPLSIRQDAHGSCESVHHQRHIGSLSSNEGAAGWHGDKQSCMHVTCAYDLTKYTPTHTHTHDRCYTQWAGMRLVCLQRMLPLTVEWGLSPGPHSELSLACTHTHTHTRICAITPSLQEHTGDAVTTGQDGLSF